MADVGVRSVAESQLRDRVAAAVSPAGDTSARISSFPFIARLLLSGDVSRITVAAADVTVEDLTLARVALDLRDVTLDRDRLVSDQTVVLEDLGRGTAEAVVTQEQLSDRLEVAVTLDDGQARVRVAGQTLSAQAWVSENTLRVEVAGYDLPPLPIPRLSLLPCVADAEILPGRIRLTCTVDQIPPELVGRPLDQLGR
ncbi:MAG: LmeA family phospholipid-binding protein [Acidimicrobiales bacterium]